MRLVEQILPRSAHGRGRHVRCWRSKATGGDTTSAEVRGKTRWVVCLDAGAALMTPEIEFSPSGLGRRAEAKLNLTRRTIADGCGAMKTALKAATCLVILAAWVAAAPFVGGGAVVLGYVIGVTLGFGRWESLYIVQWAAMIIPSLMIIWFGGKWVWPKRGPAASSEPSGD